MDILKSPKPPDKGGTSDDTLYDPSIMDIEEIGLVIGRKSTQKSAQQSASTLISSASGVPSDMSTFFSSIGKSMQQIGTTDDKSKIFHLERQHMYCKSNIYVYIERTNTDNIGRLHPLQIGHLFHHKLNLGNYITSIERSGINRVKVGVKTVEVANNLVQNPNLEKEHLRAFIPNNLLCRKGLIRGVDTCFDEFYLKSNILSSYSVSEIQRMKRRKVLENNESVFIPTQTVVLTFEGNSLPSHVIINSVNFVVEPYIQRVIQCFKCLRYGHISRLCKSTKNLCTKCSEEKSDQHSCSKISCIHCKTDQHSSTDKCCPEYINQQKIKKIIAEKNIPYLEAKKFISGNYSTIINQNRFEALNFSDPAEYPALPSINNNSKNNSPTSKNFTFSKTTKKRKANSPEASPVKSHAMFTYPFGPSQPIQNSLKQSPPGDPGICTNKKIIEGVVNLFSTILKNINNIEDIKALDNTFLLKSVGTLFDKHTTNHA